MIKEKVLTRVTEGQVVRVHIIGQEVLLVILPYVGLKSHIA